MTRDEKIAQLCSVWLTLDPASGDFAPFQGMFMKTPVDQREMLRHGMGQITRPLGSRPVAPRDQRTQSTYIFGAICPAEGKAAGLVLPFCNTAAMNLDLAEISQAVAADAHAVLLMDQAGWHTSDKLDLPANISIVLLHPPTEEELGYVFAEDGEYVFESNLADYFDDFVDEDSERFVDRLYETLRADLAKYEVETTGED